MKRQNRFSMRFLALILFILDVAVVASVSEGHGFGDDYDWNSLEDGLAVIKEEKVPGMVITKLQSHINLYFAHANHRKSCYTML